MSNSIAIPLLLVISLVAANLPWVTEKVAFVREPRSGSKSEWVRLLEWLGMFGVVAMIAAGLEMQAQGQLQPQGWEFWVIVLCLFAVLALPGFVYRHDLRRRLIKRRRRKPS